MKRIFLNLSIVLLLTSCASTVKMNGSSNYTYSGETYGVIKVEMSDAVTADTRKVVRVEQLGLERNIESYLRSKSLYDPASSNSIEITINKIHIRNAFNAIMWGFMSGSDSLEGTVTLNNGGPSPIASFDISASYALGGTGGGQNDARLGWLSEEFAKLTANTIAGEQQ